MEDEEKRWRMLSGLSELCCCMNGVAGVNPERKLGLGRRKVIHLVGVVGRTQVGPYMLCLLTNG